VRAAIDAYNRGDWESALKHAGPGFECDLSRAFGPQNDVYGRAEMQRFWAEFAEGWESVRIEPDEFIEKGEDVVAPWTMYLTYQDRAEALAVAGLRE
jgi:SnoaL-like domain